MLPVNTTPQCWRSTNTTNKNPFDSSGRSSAQETAATCSLCLRAQHAALREYCRISVFHLNCVPDWATFCHYTTCPRKDPLTKAIFLCIYFTLSDKSQVIVIQIAKKHTSKSKKGIRPRFLSFFPNGNATSNGRDWKQCWPWTKKNALTKAKEH